MLEIYVPAANCLKLQPSLLSRVHQAAADPYDSNWRTRVLSQYQIDSCCHSAIFFYDGTGTLYRARLSFLLSRSTASAVRCMMSLFVVPHRDLHRFQSLEVATKAVKKAKLSRRAVP